MTYLNDEIFEQALTDQFVDAESFDEEEYFDTLEEHELDSLLDEDFEQFH